MAATARRILVTLDGSRLAAAAIPLAMTLAADLGAEVVLLRVGLAPVIAVRPTAVSVPVLA